MPIINGPQKIDKDEIIESALKYSKVNKLDNEETNELIFICDSFRKFYNNISSKKETISPKKVLEKFNTDVVSSVSKSWTGLNTDADVFYTEVPLIKKIIEEDTIEKSIKKKTATPSSHASHSRSSSYGGCGGGSRSYGPSC